MKRNYIIIAVNLAALVCLNTRGADDLTALCADRAAIERVYHQHRTGEKPPFEQVLPAEAIRRSVERDQQREAALRRTYGVEITNAQLDAEVNRIEANTRAPEILTELKRALDNDPARFARAVARPALVERELRARFENDDALHAQARHQCEDIRHRCLEAKAAHGVVQEIVAMLKLSGAGEMTEQTWNLDPRPQSPDKKEQTHLEDLPPQLRQIFEAQLRQPGDVSAVIEMADRFLLFVATAQTTGELRTTSFSIPKLNLETWLNELSPVASAKLYPTP